MSRCAGSGISLYTHIAPPIDSAALENGTVGAEASQNLGVSLALSGGLAKASLMW